MFDRRRADAGARMQARACCRAHAAARMLPPRRALDLGARDSVYFANSPNGNKSSFTIVTSSIRALALLIVSALLLGAASAPAWAGALSAYLPLNLEPEIERQIERVLILADEPILKRPIPVELVRLALPQACAVDRSLCKKVRRY